MSGPSHCHLPGVSCPSQGWGHTYHSGLPAQPQFWTSACLLASLSASQHTAAQCPGAQVCPQHLPRLSGYSRFHHCLFTHLLFEGSGT